MDVGVLLHFPTNQSLKDIFQHSNEVICPEDGSIKLHSQHLTPVYTYTWM